MPSLSIDRLSGVSASVAVKAPCRCTTTANITLSGLQTIDGITVAADDRVLVKDQTDTTQNGIYVASSTSWERAPDFDGARDVVSGTLVYINAGTTYSDSFWHVSTVGDPTPGSAMAFSRSNMSLAGVSAFWQSILGLTSTAASMTALGVSTFGQSMIANSSAIQVRSTLGFPTTGAADGIATVNASGMYRGSSITMLSTAGVLKGHYALLNLTTSTAIVLSASDAGTVIVLNSSLGGLVTAPSSTSTTLPVGFQVALSQKSTGTYTGAVQAADTLLVFSSKINLAGQNALATFLRQSSTSWLLAGNLST